MRVDGITIFNFLSDGSIVTEGDHNPAVGDGVAAPFASLGIKVTRADVGDYHILGPGLKWPAGWKVTIFKDENDENTVRVTLGTIDGGLRIQCVDPDTHEAKDVIYMMTVRTGVEGEVAFEAPVLAPPPAYTVALVPTVTDDEMQAAPFS